MSQYLFQYVESCLTIHLLFRLMPLVINLISYENHLLYYLNLNYYAAFESDLKGPASEVYLHEMPGGQFTNLKEQARSLGLESRWHEVAQTYSDVNHLFGDIIKVTPSSKVVGDMALMLVSQDMKVEDIRSGAREISYPESVVSMYWAV